MSSERKDLATTEKQELKEREEKTFPGKYYIPRTDITETQDALLVYMDVPGVRKENIKVKLENNVLEVEGLIDSLQYKDFEPFYSEYNVGHYSRSFKLSNAVDQNNIEAKIIDGVLTLTLKKAPEAKPKLIQVA